MFWLSSAIAQGASAAFISLNTRAASLPPNCLTLVGCLCRKRCVANPLTFGEKSLTQLGTLQN